jgi:hypothetical protein
MGGQKRGRSKKFSGITNSNPIITSFTDFSKNKSLYLEINKYGYKIFTLSSVTIDLINNYGPQNIPTKLSDAEIPLPEVMKDFNFKTDSPIYDKTRKAATFFRIDYLKDIDSDLYNIVMCTCKELMEITDLSKWFNIKDSDIWNEYLHITLNFLISIACKSTVKIEDGIQAFHSDYPIIKKINNDGTTNEYYESNYPLSVIIALQNDSRFRFLCNSHRQYNENGEPNATSYHSKLLTLQQGQLIIFHPNLLHSGNIYLYIYIIIIIYCNGVIFLILILRMEVL